MKKYYSILSGVFFIMATFPLLAGLTKFGNFLYVDLLKVSIFFPLVLGVIGLIFSLMGIKGKVKISLVLMNTLGIVLSLFLVFIAINGFQNP
ncbi:hypothetical protein [Priestia koreensis]|uniref:Uncharacterized protein n=1 Tax=Priestia koreensis TaxID=284581 RepID=A0A0M0LA13_9BACI|nr:hypothetical protein [Priestia koreensis]KOO47453.1 hypothetical protein AMD01_05220 [Priestia koreensis]